MKIKRKENILDDNIVKAFAGIVGTSPESEPYRTAIQQPNMTLVISIATANPPANLKFTGGFVYRLL
jgi:hypothetical protein